MTNLEKYNNAFVEVFNIESSELNGEFSKDTAANWDSIHQLNLVAQIEEVFDIMLDAEDIMELTSYEAGRMIMAKYEVEL